MKMLKLILLMCNVLIWLKFSNSMDGHKTLKIDRFIQCPEYKNLTLIMQKPSLKRIGKKYVTSAKLVVLETTSNQLQAGLRMVRCKSREALDTCESVPDVSFSGVCFLFNFKIPPFGEILNTVKPPMKCPIEKGTYTATNSTIDETVISALPLEGWYWKIHVLVFDMCKIISYTTSAQPRSTIFKPTNFDFIHSPLLLRNLKKLHGEENKN